MGAPPPGEDKQIPPTAVGTEGAGQDAAAGRSRLQHRRPRPVAEKDAGAAIFPVGKPGEDIRSYHQDIAVDASPDERGRHGKSIDEAGASGEQVECRRPVGTQSSLDQAGYRGEKIIRGHRSHHDQVQFPWLQPRPLQGLPCRGDAQVRIGPSLLQLTPLADTGTCHNPFVTGVHHLLQVPVGNNRPGQGGTGTGYHGTRSFKHHLSPLS